MREAQKAWVIQDAARVVSKPGYWTGYDLQFSERLSDAVRFYRKIDAERVIRGLMLNGKAAEMEMANEHADKA